jgi:hypothetical protein
MPGARFERFGATLWRWTTPHPLWTPKDADHTGGWPRDVGSVVFARDGTATIFDPQAAEDDDELWAFLAERTADAGRIVVALTASWHLRSSVAVLDRLGGEIRLHRQAAGDTVMRGLGRVRPFVADGKGAGRRGAAHRRPDQRRGPLLAPRARRVRRRRGVPRPAGRAARRARPLRALGRRALRMAARARRLPVTLVLPTHGPPADDGPGVVRDAIARPPWRLFGSG